MPPKSGDGTQYKYSDTISSKPKASIMADTAAAEVVVESESNSNSNSDHKLSVDSENGSTKRAREEAQGEAGDNGEKKAKMEVEKSDTDGKQADEESTEVIVGPKIFGSSVDMFDYFYKILHAWPANLNLNEYEHIVLLELLKNGHLEAERKIGKGVKAFQVRFHPQFKSRCFFLVRVDDTVDDFSFRKCVDHILPLPQDFQVKHDVNKALRGKGGGGRGRGRGRGGR